MRAISCPGMRGTERPRYRPSTTVGLFAVARATGFDTDTDLPSRRLRRFALGEVDSIPVHRLHLLPSPPPSQT
jgi:hypothetical protein